MLETGRSLGERPRGNCLLRPLLCQAPQPLVLRDRMGIAAVGRGARAVGLQVGAWLTQEAIRLLVVAKGHRMRMLGNEGALAPILLRADVLAALGAAALLTLPPGGPPPRGPP